MNAITGLLWHGITPLLCTPACSCILVLACIHPGDRLVGLVVKASASRAEDPGFESCWQRDFSGSSHTRDLKIGIPVATLPDAWCYIGSMLGLVGPVSVYCDWVK